MRSAIITCAPTGAIHTPSMSTYPLLERFIERGPGATAAPGYSMTRSNR